MPIRTDIIWTYQSIAIIDTVAAPLESVTLGRNKIYRLSNTGIEDAWYTINTTTPIIGEPPAAFLGVNDEVFVIGLNAKLQVVSAAPSANGFVVELVQPAEFSND